MALLDEITARAAVDPEFADLVTARNDVAIAAALSEGRTEVRPVTVRTLSAWAAFSVRGRLEKERLNPESPVYSIALAALDLLGKPMDETFDTIMYAPLLNALQGAGVILDSEREALTSRSRQPAPVTDLEVRRACWSDTGEWLA